MPVAYQSRAGTEPQREAVSRRLTEGLTPKGNSFISPKGVAKFYKRYSFVRLPGGGYFSVKKSNQKSLGEDPETPTRRYTPPGKAAPSRRIGAPGGTQGPLGKGGRTAAGRAARSIAKGQHDSSGGCVRRDDADKVPQAHFM